MDGQWSAGATLNLELAAFSWFRIARKTRVGDGKPNDGLVLPYTSMNIT